jgi:tripartite ATP-independent transporter DctM subunit
MLSLLMIGIFVLLLFLRMPVSIAIGLSTIPPLMLMDRDLALLPQFMLKGVNSVALLSVPFFILAGNLFSALGLGRRIWDFARTMVGHFRGGLAHVMVLSNMIFAGISGSALADAAGLGALGIPEMERSGYRRKFAAAVTLCSSVIGPMIPPSINLIIYGVIAQVSIGKLFLAGVIPGIVIGVSMMIFIWIMAVYGREPMPVAPRANVKERTKAFYAGLPAMAVPVIVVAGMSTGAISPTEVGIVAAAYALLLGLVYREATLRDVYASVKESANQSINIMFIIAVSTVAGWIFTYEGTAQKVAEWLFTLTTDKTALLLIINLFLLLLGCLLEPIPLLILVAPILIPVVKQLGVDLIQFGIIMNLNITIGIITPPMGIGLYVMTRVSGVRFEDLVRSCAPLMIPLLFALLLFTYVPWLSLWLPSVLMGV